MKFSHNFFSPHLPQKRCERIANGLRRDYRKGAGEKKATFSFVIG